MDLLSLLKRPESKTLKFKRDLSSPDGVLRTLVAFANTAGGVLLLGKERGRYLPDAWIQAGRFGGTDKTHITDTLNIRSLPVRAVEETVAFVRKHALHGMEIGTTHRRERWNLPPVAVREVVINAVAHTDYSQLGAPIRVSIFDNRLEVESPGLLPFGLNLRKLARIFA